MFPLFIPSSGTGARPSELLGLKWGDVDLRTGFITSAKADTSTRKARPKTADGDRAIKLFESVGEVLKRLKPLHTTENDYVFLNQEGNPLSFHTWRAGIWYRILRGVEIRPRRPYCTRPTFISVGLSNGVNIGWLAEYCGTSLPQSSGITGNTSRAMQPNSLKDWLEP